MNPQGKQVNAAGASRQQLRVLLPKQEPRVEAVGGRSPAGIQQMDRVVWACGEETS